MQNSFSGTFSWFYVVNNNNLKVPFLQMKTSDFLASDDTANDFETFRAEFCNITILWFTTWNLPHSKQVFQNAVETETA